MTRPRSSALRRAAPATVLAAALLTTMLTSGCASEEDRYCEALREAEPQLKQLSRRADRAPAAATLDSIPVLAALEDEAPPELVDEWTTVLNALRTFREVVRSSGVETGPGAARAIEQLPADDRDAVQRAAGRLAQPGVLEASAGIEDYGAQVCDVRLGI